MQIRIPDNAFSATIEIALLLLQNSFESILQRDLMTLVVFYWLHTLEKNIVAMNRTLQRCRKIKNSAIERNQNDTAIQLNLSKGKLTALTDVKKGTCSDRPHSAKGQQTIR